MLKKYGIRFLLGGFLLLFFCGHAVNIWRIPFVDVLDAYFYDVRVRMSADGSVDERIVIVDIDEKSLAEVGRWPWGRDRVGEMVRQLTDRYKVAVVGFDVVFAEPDTSSGLPVLEKIGKETLRDNPAFQSALKTLKGSLDYDQQFAGILKGRPVVLGYYFTSESDRRYGVLPQPLFMKGTFDGRNIQFQRYPGYGANLAGFQAAAASAGHFNPAPDADGIFRRVAMLVEYDGNYYEALSLAIVRQLLGTSLIRPGFSAEDKGMEWIEVIGEKARVRIPVDEHVTALIPFRGPQNSFRYVSAGDVLRGTVPPELLNGRIVLVGTTAPGLKDLRATPVGAVYAGVEAHANLIAGMLDQSIKEKPWFVMGFETLQLLVFGGALVFLLPLVSPLRATLLTVTWLLLALALNLWLWQVNFVLPLASFFLLVLLLYGLDAAWGYFVESRTKRQLTGLFGQYVPPELVDQMAQDPENYSMEGKNERLTVLFSDVRSFTTISEGLDPKELTQLMNAYLGEMTQVIRKRHGTLDKYIGDAIMAFWGAPVANPEHARQAVLTALEMQLALRNLDAPFKARGWPALHIGVGVNTGMMTVGDMGSPVRQAYTVMGDAVNLGSRLESITKQYGVGIIVGEGTRAEVGDVVFRELDRVRVKGKDDPVAIFEPLGIEGKVAPEALAALDQWERALKLYRAQEWDLAEVQLRQLHKGAPECKLYALYLERIALYRANPPGEQWDGVTTYETK